MSLALLIVVMAVVIAFVDEFGGVFKKMTSIGFVRLFIPIIVASLIVLQYEHTILGLLLKLREGLLSVVQMIVLGIPFGTPRLGMRLAQMIVLFLIPCVPLWCFWAYKRYRKLSEIWPYAGWVGCVAWLSGAILITAIIPAG